MYTCICIHAHICTFFFGKQDLTCTEVTHTDTQTHRHTNTSFLGDAQLDLAGFNVTQTETQTQKHTNIQKHRFLGEAQQHTYTQHTQTQTHLLLGEA